MSLLNQAERLRSSLVAAIAGWLAGLLFSIPIEAGIAWRNTDGQPGLMAESFVFGMVIWATWTLIFTLLGWLIVAVPLVLVVSPQWMRSHQRVVMVMLVAATVVLPGRYFGLYTLLKAVHQFDQHNFIAYSGFGVCCAVTALITYLQLEEGPS